jgi:rod shape-determining protein MreD
MTMRQFLAVTLTLAALVLEPLVGQAFGDFSFRPNLYLAPLALTVSLCPGAGAVVWCGILGLILDCLAGPQLGARAACFCLLAALGSLTVGRSGESLSRRVASWGAMLFVAEILSRIIQVSSVGGTFRPIASVLDAGLSAGATTVFLGGLWLAGQIVWRGPRRAPSIRRMALDMGRDASGD